ncbi:putative secreted protein with PEP-CTERM sorting signal [Nonomuraea polychroma]|uniref:Putative secreted protein with PEP-CTERM sorting signal n=1 Tax=Nonomuraea polychroma TaxID=46176 RepID=A0A438MFL3_9ACTN|nr:hypothetical protein [Nonomuraea polychroma]RVX44544.1 putative secreted protein with PEP-CTERM sorting signal [Nonomuraea polychroma]
MAREITRSVLLAALLGGGIAWATIGSATAAYGKPYPPYPPHEQATQFQDAKQKAKRRQAGHQRSNSTVDVRVNDRPYVHGHEPTGEAATVTGAGALFAGAAGAAIARRRRETAGAK